MSEAIDVSSEICYRCGAPADTTAWVLNKGEKPVCEDHTLRTVSATSKVDWAVDKTTVQSSTPQPRAEVHITSDFSITTQDPPPNWFHQQMHRLFFGWTWTDLRKTP